MKSFFVFLITLMFVMPVASQAFEISGDQVVAGVQTPTATKSTPPAKPAVVAPAPVKYVGLTLNQIKGAFNESALALKKGDNEEKKEREASVDNSLGIVNGNIVALDDNLNGKKGTIKTLSSNMKELVSVVKSSNTWLVISMFGVVLLALLIVVALVGLWLRKSLPGFKRAITPDTAKLKKEIVDEVSVKIQTAQGNTIGAVNSAAAHVIRSVGFNTDPFCWDIEINSGKNSGKRFKVTYNFSPEWVGENKGFPRLHVPKNYSGDVNAYESNPYPTRRKAENDCESTVKKYLSGDFGNIDPKATDFKNEFTAQKEYVQALEKNGQLLIHEIAVSVPFSL